MDVLKWIANPGMMVDWFKSQMQRFFTLPAEIAATRRRAQAIQAILERKGDSLNQQKISEAIGGLDKVSSTHHSVQSRVSDLFSKLGAVGIKMPGLAGYHPPQLGLPIAIPATLVLAGGAVALAIAAVFADYRKQVNIIHAVESGALTAEEAKALGAGRPIFGFDISKIALPLGALALLIFVGPRLARAR